MTAHEDGCGVVNDIDPTTPNPARIYDYLLGGKDNFPADRHAAEELLNVVPQARQGARQNRAFLQRAVRADLRQPEAILDHPQVRGVLDFTQPVAMLLIAVLHFIRDAEHPVGIVTTLREAMAPGSFLVLSHATADFHPDVAAKVTAIYQQASAPLVLRTRAQIERFFDGFDLVEPGLVQPAAWRPHDARPGMPAAGGFYSGVGRRPSAEPTPSTTRR